MKRVRFTIIITFILACIIIGVDAKEEYSKAKGIIRVHSYISTGSYSPDTLVEMAKKQEIQVIIFTENALLRCEYGLSPLRKLIKRRVQMNYYRLDIETQYPHKIISNPIFVQFE